MKLYSLDDYIFRKIPDYYIINNNQEGNIWIHYTILETIWFSSILLINKFPKSTDQIKPINSFRVTTAQKLPSSNRNLQQTHNPFDQRKHTHTSNRILDCTSRSRK